MSDSIANNASTLTGKVVTVTAGARLHFGLLSTAAPFGGVGVMIDRPRTEVRIRSAPSFQCPSELIDRILPIAQRISDITGPPQLTTCQVEVTRRPESHHGLGSGTQLALATAEALADFCNLDVNEQTLASEIAGRGKRSAVGVHGYFQGGLIYEDADAPCDLNPCRQRVALAKDWCVGLFQPAELPRQVSGQLEQAHFRDSQNGSDERTRRALRAIITDELIPAAMAEDFATFANAVYRYNHQSGLLFREVQDGPYNGRSVVELIELLQHHGAVGVGQSSWGPTVFAWFEDAERADAFARTLPKSVTTIGIARPLNQQRSLGVSRTR